MAISAKGAAVRRVWLCIQVALPGLLVVGALVGLKWWVLDDIAPAELTAFFEKFGAWAPLVFLAVLALRPVAFLPGQILCAVGGLVFGTTMGSIYALIGSALSTTLLFFGARSFGTRPLQRLLGARYHPLSRIARKRDFQVSAVCTLNPLLPTDVTIMAGAAAGARYGHLLVGVLLGTLPGTVITAHFGSSLRQGNNAMSVAAGIGLVLSLILGAFFGRSIVRELRESPRTQQSPATHPPVPELAASPVAPRAS